MENHYKNSKKQNSTLPLSPSSLQAKSLIESMKQRNDSRNMIPGTEMTRWGAWWWWGSKGDLGVALRSLSTRHQHRDVVAVQQDLVKLRHATTFTEMKPL